MNPAEALAAFRPNLEAARYAHGPGWDLYQGDTLRLLLALSPDLVDAVVTDAPYSSGGAMRGDRMADTVSKYSGGSTTLDFAGDTRDQHAFAHWCALWFAEALRVTKPGGFLFTFTDWRQLPAMSDAMQAGGWVWRGMVGWDKTPAVRPAKGRPRNQMEYVLWGTKGPHAPWERVRLPDGSEVVRPMTFGVDPAPGETVLEDAPCPVGFYSELPDGFAEPPEVMQHTIPRVDRHHIAQKPVGALADLLTVIPPGGLVLDPFSGSGTTGEAALRTGRRAILFEIMESNCALTRDRLLAVRRGQTVSELRTGQVALFDALSVAD